MEDYLEEPSIANTALSNLATPAGRQEQFVQRYMNDLHVNRSKLMTLNEGFQKLFRSFAAQLRDDKNRNGSAASNASPNESIESEQSATDGSRRPS